VSALQRASAASDSRPLQLQRPLMQAELAPQSALSLQGEPLAFA